MYHVADLNRWDRVIVTTPVLGLARQSIRFPPYFFPDPIHYMSRHWPSHYPLALLLFLTFMLEAVGNWDGYATQPFLIAGRPNPYASLFRQWYETGPGCYLHAQPIIVMNPTLLFANIQTG